MTLSRMAAAFLIVAPAPTTVDTPPSPPPDADRTMASYRLMMRLADPSCDARREGSDIVVCGSRERQQQAEQRRQRLPLPGERGPRDGARQPTGVMPSAGDMPGGPCSRRGSVCDGEGGIDVLKVVNTLGNILGVIVSPED